MVNCIILSVAGLSCFLPIIHILALSFSSGSAAAQGAVGLWPVNFTTAAYKFVLAKKEFLDSLKISVMRTLVGTVLSMIITILCAYPLSKRPSTFKARKVYIWVFVFAMLFNGGLIPTYLVVKSTGLIDNFFALIIPCAMNIFNIILMMNFFRGIPVSLEEAAYLDGAGHLSVLCKIFLPLSTPSLATIGLFTVIGHWNSWFDGMIYNNNPVHYPFATYLQSIVKASVNLSLNKGYDIETIKQLMQLSDQTLQAAQVFLGSLPILLVYPFIQKYFTTGLTLGGVKE